MDTTTRLSSGTDDTRQPIVFIGGWGSASYQYGFEGTYHNF